MVACIVKDLESGMSKSTVRRTYLGDLLIFVTVVLLGSCSTTDFASLQPHDGVEVATRVTSPWPSHAGPGSARFTDVALISKENLQRSSPLGRFARVRPTRFSKIPRYLPADCWWYAARSIRYQPSTHLQVRRRGPLIPRLNECVTPTSPIVVRWLNGLILRRCLPKLSQTDRPSKPVRIACLWRLTMRV